MLDPNTFLTQKEQALPAIKYNPELAVPKQFNPNTNPGPGYVLPDEYKNYDFNFVPGIDMNEMRAQNQTGWELASKGVARLLTGAVFEMAKVVPYLGGGLMTLGASLAGADNPMSYMVDNAILNGIEAAQDTFNEDIMPIYQTHAANGSLMDRMFDPTFWATQGADAGSFFLSMIIPGRLAAGAGIDDDNEPAPENDRRINNKKYYSWN